MWPHTFWWIFYHSFRGRCYLYPQGRTHLRHTADSRPQSSQYSDQTTGWMIWVRFPADITNFSSLIMYRLAPGPNQTHTPWVPACFSGDKAGRVWSWQLHLVSRLRMRGAIPLIPLCAFMVWSQKTSLFPTLQISLYITGHENSSH